MSKKTLLESLTLGMVIGFCVSKFAKVISKKEEVEEIVEDCTDEQ